MITNFKIFEGFIKKKEIKKDINYHHPYSKNFFISYDYEEDNSEFQLILELHSFDGLYKYECEKFLYFLENIFYYKLISHNMIDYKTLKNKSHRLDTRVFKITLNKKSLNYIYFLYDKLKSEYFYKTDENGYYFNNYYEGNLIYCTSQGNYKKLYSTIEELIDSYKPVLLKDIDNEDQLTKYLIKEIDENHNIINNDIFKKCIENNKIIYDKYDYLFNAKNFDLI